MFTPALAKSDQKDPILAPGENQNVQNLPDFKDHGVLQLDPANKYPSDYLTIRRRKIVKQLNPSQNAKAVVELGDIHLAKRELRHAREAYADAIRKDPDLIDAYKKLIPLMLADNNLKGADKYYLRLVQRTNNHPDYEHGYLLFRLTFFAAQDGELDKIETKLKTLIQQHPTEVTYKITQGIILLMYRMKPSQAQQLFQSVLDQQPNNVDALNNIGISLQHQQQYEEALKKYKKAIQVDPSYSTAYENIASNYMAQDMFDKALDVLSEGKTNKLEFTPLWEHNVGWLMLLNHRLLDAKKWYTNKIKEEPGNNFLFNNLGVCCENLGELKNAQKHYQTSVELFLTIKKVQPNHEDPRAIHAFYNLCRLLRKNDNFPLLEVVAKHLLSVSSDDPAGYYYLGSARIQLKKYTSARQMLEQSIVLESKVADPYIDLSFLQTCIFHEYEGAIELLTNALACGVEHEFMVNNLAFAYIKHGDMEKAQQVLAFDEKYPNTKATRGLLEFYKGNFKSGNALYAGAIKSIPADKKNEATQIWHYEQAAYWFRKGDLKKTGRYLKDAKGLGKESFIYNDIVKLERDAKKSKSNKQE